MKYLPATLTLEKQFHGAITLANMEQIINTGKWTSEELNLILHKASGIKDDGKRIGFISRLFLDVSYAASTLIGEINSPEVFVINLGEVDCFTFIDYVEAMRLSSSFSAFIENLKRVRYHSGEISFENRNHFFTDWVEHNSGFVKDVTDLVGEHRAVQVMEKLNLKKDGTYFIEGIKPVEREIRYIPSSALDNSVIQRLESGDYAGIYSDKEGLDVSHVGIIIRKEGMIYLRHASSKLNVCKVVDEGFTDYIAGKAGLIVLRPK